ncbi:hypothetical protein M3Y97_00642200 [Aphelenchoides bicaudatus]|nr:hypothetical protein M3Y97_00642200 [Aphelenchoides bicaudatus]
MTRELKVIYPNFFPMVNKNCESQHETRWCQFPGIAVEIIGLLAKHMNMTICEVEFDHSLGPERIFDDNQHFTGLYQHLQNESADLIATTTEDLELRRVAWDFTVALYQSETKIAVRKLDNTLSSIFDFFSVYGTRTWFFMLLTFLTFTGFGLLVRLVELRAGLRDNYNGCSLVWKMVRLQLIQPSKFIYKLTSGNFALLVFSFLQCSIVLSLYQSWILTSVVQQRKSLPFDLENILKALKERKYYLATAMPNAWYFELIELAERDPYLSLAHILERQRVKLCATVEQSLELAEDKSQNAIVIVQNDQFDGHIVSDYCELETVESPFPKMNETFMMRKDHPLLPELNKAIEAQRIPYPTNSPKILHI